MADALLVSVRKIREYRHTGHVQVLNDAEMFERYRFTNHGVDFLENLLCDDLQRQTKRSFALSPRQQILLALRYYASGAMYQVIGDTMGFDKSTVSRSVDQVTGALLKHLPTYVQWPDENNRKKIMTNLYNVAGFPNVIGCVDGTHVRIKAPSVDEASYVNRKGYHSIAVQAVCDHQGRFTSINASWPGSCHDSHVFRTSGLCARLQRENKSFSDGVLLGDSGYPCRPFLMTPFLSTETEAKERYQQSHSRTRVVIERTFGQWKRKFHVLHSEIRLSPAKTCNVIVACVILHNISILLNEPVYDLSEEFEDDVGNNPVEMQRDGAGVRDFIVGQYFS